MTALSTAPKYGQATSLYHFKRYRFILEEVILEKRVRPYCEEINLTLPYLYILDWAFLGYDENEKEKIAWKPSTLLCANITDVPTAETG